MNSRRDQIKYYLKQLGISVDLGDFMSDLDEISDSLSDTFWDDMYREGGFDTAISNADDLLDEQLEELPYILTCREADEDWDQSDDYEAFRDLVREEVFERGDIPDNENEAQSRSDSGDFEEEEENT